MFNFFSVSLFALACLSMQKIPFSAEMQMLRGTRTPFKREQWFQASTGAGTAFEPLGIIEQLIHNQLISPQISDIKSNIFLLKKTKTMPLDKNLKWPFRNKDC